MRGRFSKIMAVVLALLIAFQAFGSDFASIASFATSAEDVITEELSEEKVAETATGSEEKPEEVDTLEEQDVSDIAGEGIAIEEDVQQDETQVVLPEETEAAANSSTSASSENGANAGESTSIEVEADAATSASSEVEADAATSASSVEEVVAATSASSEEKVSYEEVFEKQYVDNANGIVIKLYAAEGVLPDDAELVVKMLSSETLEANVGNAIDEMSSEEYSVEQVFVYDITIHSDLLDSDVQPDGSVRITFESVISSDETENTALAVYHVQDNGSEVSSIEQVGSTVSNTTDITVDTTHFSDYAIASLSRGHGGSGAGYNYTTYAKHIDLRFTDADYEKYLGNDDVYVTVKVDNDEHYMLYNGSDGGSKEYRAVVIYSRGHGYSYYELTDISIDSSIEFIIHAGDKTYSTGVLDKQVNKEAYYRCGYDHGWGNTGMDFVFSLPEVIEEDPEEEETTEYTYTVEYFKTVGETSTEVAADKQTVTKEVVVSATAIGVNKEDINLTDKYEGYTFDKIVIGATESTELPSEVPNGTTIQVYYKADATEYTVNVYKQSTLFGSNNDAYELVKTVAAEAEADSTVTLSEVLALDEVKAAVNSLKGYEFKKAVSGETELSDDTAVTILTGENGTVISVYYNLIPYTVTLDLNGGEITSMDQSKDNQTYYMDLGVEYKVNEDGTITLTYTASSDNFALPYATKLREDFLGWVDNSNAVVRVISEIMKDAAKDVTITTSSLKNYSYKAEYISGVETRYYILAPGATIKKEITSKTTYVPQSTIYFSRSVGTSKISDYVFSNYKSYAELTEEDTANNLVEKELYGFVPSDSVSEDGIIEFVYNGVIWRANVYNVDWYVIKSEYDGWHVDGRPDWYELCSELNVEDYEGFYDGESHTITVTATEGSTYKYWYSTDGQSWTEAADGKLPEFTDAGIYYVKVEATYASSGEAKVQTKTGTVTIKKLPIEYQAISARKLFDGKELTCDKYQVTGSYVKNEGEGVTVSVVGSQLVVGTSPNTISATFDDEVINLNNYEIVYKPGTLEVIGRTPDDGNQLEIVVQAASGTYVYDGTTKSADGYTITVVDPSEDHYWEGYDDADNGNGSDDASESDSASLGQLFNSLSKNLASLFVLRANAGSKTDVKAFSFEGVDYTATGITAMKSAVNVGSYTVPADIAGAVIMCGSVDVTDQFKIVGKNGVLKITPVNNTTPDNPSGGTTPTTDETTVVPVTATSTAAVLGANREATSNQPSVLGARRAGTDDTSNMASRIVIIVICAGIVATLLIADRNKKKEKPIKE